MKMFATLFIFLITHLSHSGYPRKISQMPFYDGPHLNITQYSGYLDIPYSDTKTGRTYNHHLFYVLVKNTIVTDAPLLIWLDGGPGCSSLGGYLREHGPFSVHRTSSGAFKAIPREFSWTNFAHILYIDSPIGTGFSYSDDRTDYKNLGDEMTAHDLYSGILTFLDLFPDLRNNRLFITGESYAGHFVPQVTQLIDQSLQLNQIQTINPNLQGYLIGNGVTDYQYMVNSLPKFLTNHFLVPKSDYDEAFTECKGDFYLHFFDKNCSTALGKLTSILYDGVLNPLDIYAECEISGISPLICNDLGGPEEYVNSKEFLSAFGVDLKNTLLGSRYEMCVNLEPDFVYSLSDKSVSQIPIHLNLTKKYPFLFYSRDADTIVNTLASEMIMDVLMKQSGQCVDVDEKVWFYSSKSSEGKILKQFGGRARKCGNINFVTVRGAGHQVPVTKLMETYDIIRNFVVDP